MAKKDDLIAQARSMGIELDSNETVADLEAKIAAAKRAAEGSGEAGSTMPPPMEPGVYVLNDEAEMTRLPAGGFVVKQGDGVAEITSLEDAEGDCEDVAEGQVKRSRVNRGSRRRIERTITSLNKEIDAAIKELDMQAFVADDDGNRTGEWNAVTRLRKAKAEINDQVNQLLAG